ncbi:MAG: hypothetical protein IPF68_10375 [Bacteroidales bacterium]|nr:hypothetical protein [Bacteroidales bacterium]
MFVRCSTLKERWFDKLTTGGAISATGRLKRWSESQRWSEKSVQAFYFLLFTFYFFTCQPTGGFEL